jgi:ribonucleotide reductase alpha subunit
VAILTDISNMAMSYGIIAKQCGEQPLLSGESCNLGSIDLGKLVNIDSEFDFEGFGHVVEYAVRFLDDIIDVNQHPTAQTRNMNILTRKIGLGIMGFADCLVRMGISYSSDEAIEVVHQIGAVLENTSDAYSSYLGAMKGDFPEFEHSLLNTKNGGIWEHMRNSWKRSLAPTGCQIRSNQILTPEGMKSVQLILEEASIDWRNVETHDGGVWFTIPPIEIWTKEGIGVSTKIYYNGKVDTKTITFEDGQQYTFTLNHPLLANRNGQHVWVQVGDLQIGDDIVEVAVNGKLPLEASYVLQDL